MPILRVSLYNLSVTFGDTSPGRRGFGIAQTSPLCQGLPYKGSCRAVGETERLYYMARFRFALRFPAGFPSYNLSVTCGDTSPCRRGFGIAQTSPPRQRLPYQGSWHREAMTERLYYMIRFRFALRFPEGFPSYNLSVTCGDTSPCKRGLGILQTLPPRQWLPYQGSWRA